MEYLDKHKVNALLEQFNNILRKEGMEDSQVFDFQLRRQSEDGCRYICGVDENGNPYCKKECD